MRWISFLTIILIPIFAFFILIYKTLPSYTGTLFIESLQHPVQITRDEHAIPLIVAESTEDADFTLGYVHASDRLFQMDVIRRLATGRMSEMFGSSMLEHDQFARTLGFHRKAAKVCSKEGEQLTKLQYYARGINYYASNTNLLPLEYYFLWFRFEEWSAEDSAAVYQFIAFLNSHSWAGDLLRYTIAKVMGDSILDVLLPTDPENLPPLTYTISDDELNSQLKGQNQVKKPSGKVAGNHPGGTAKDQNVNRGSNAWVVSGRHTKSEKPMLSFDSHLPFMLPSPYFMVRTVTNGYEVSGMTTPGIPIIMAGRNEHASWGLTTAHVDTVDIYLERLDMNSPNSYFYDGEVRKMESHTEEISVRFGFNNQFVVRETHNGPILHNWENAPVKLASSYPAGGVDINMSIKYSVNTLENDESMMGFFLLSQARTHARFTDAMKMISCPALNMLYTFEDKIGYQLLGTIPIRQYVGNQLLLGWEPNHAWKGIIPFDELPSVVDPTKGYIISSNNVIVPPSYKHFYSLGYWYSEGRNQRIEQLLSNKIQWGHKLTQSDFTNILQDEVDVHCLDILPNMLGLTRSESLAETVEQLRNWNCKMDIYSKEATIYNSWLVEIASEIIQDELQEHPNLQKAILRNPLFKQWMHKLWRSSLSEIQSGSDDTLSGRMCDNIRTSETETCEDLLSQTLYRALARIEHGTPYWGYRHLIKYQHLLSMVFSPLGWIADSEVVTGGTEYTPKMADMDLNEPFHATTGPAFKLITDGASTWWGIDGGQSGSLLSDYFRDQEASFQEGNLSSFEIGDRKSGYVLNLKKP